ncbi:Type IV fimbrial biogenesis protein PilW [Oxalobacteraceae bacterium IMCC9480]|nr:Type IV fimbrial biogenesis protein PilW [Oxalobacteraceae bacterium IMCC9480]NDP58501.1 prepilin-type N-terminal cleavage/methylation domain-containing protein [Oxalobacteraceae bacterium]
MLNSHTRSGSQRGVSLIEVMIGLVLGLLVVGIAGTVFLAARRAYDLQESHVEVSEAGRYAIESITRAVRQSASSDLARSAVLEQGNDGSEAAISGLDVRSLRAGTQGIEQALPGAVNGSDVLAVRFAGADDGSVLDCAGFDVGIPATASPGQLSGWSIFFVARDARGEPELHCKYRGHNSWSSAAIVRGVEAFQVLYGIGPDMASLPTRFLTASQIDALDQQLALSGATPEQRAQDRNRQTHWKKITDIRIALLVRSMRPVRTDALDQVFDLFGAPYADQHAASDPGTRLVESALPAKDRNRLRKLFTATVRIRNATLAMPR